VSPLRHLRRNTSKKAVVAREKATRRIDDRGARRFTIFAIGLLSVFAIVIAIVIALLIGKAT
jgi:hypothetical protein